MSTEILPSVRGIGRRARRERGAEALFYRQLESYPRSTRSTVAPHEARGRGTYWLVERQISRAEGHQNLFSVPLAAPRVGKVHELNAQARNMVEGNSIAPLLSSSPEAECARLQAQSTRLFAARSRCYLLDSLHLSAGHTNPGTGPTEEAQGS